jgi:hypothetical protein
LALWLNRFSVYSYMTATVLGARVISYLLYPNGDQRYTGVLYVIVLVALVIGIRLRLGSPAGPILEESPRALDGATVPVSQAIVQ